MNALQMVKLAGALSDTEFFRRMVNPEWTATVAAPLVDKGQVVMPAWQQFDNFDRTRNQYVSGDHPSTAFLKDKHYRIPDVRGLPQGQYYVGNAANAAWRQRMAGRVFPAEHGLPALEGALSLAAKPSPKMTGVNQVDMARYLNSWRRKALKQDPVINKAFRMFSHPKNTRLLSMIGTGLKSLR